MAVFEEAGPVRQGDPLASHGSMVYLMGACTVAAMGGLLFGFDTAVINGTVERLARQFALSPWMKGWVVSSALVGCLFGSAMAGALCDWLGRKRVLFLAALLFIASAIGCAMPQGSTAVQQLIFARWIGGMGIGIASMLSPLYIAEIAPPRLRGGLIAMYQLAITVGVLAAYLSNYGLWCMAQRHSGLFVGHPWQWIFVDEVWRGMFAAGIVPAVVLFFSLLLVPESPRWLTKQGRTEEARNVLVRVSGRDEAARSMTEIQDALAQETGSLGQLLLPGMRLALLIGVVLPFASQVSGINVIIYYGESVFKAAGYAENASLVSQIVFGTVNVLFTLVAILMVDKLGRKPLLLTGIAGVGTMLFLSGLFFLLNAWLPSWLLIVLVACYLACFSFSYGPVCWIIIAEIFPTSIRGRAMSIGTFSIWTGCTLVAQTWPYLLATLGPTTTFWLYGLTTPLAFAFVLLLVPETKGKTLEQIEKHWMH